MKNFHIFIAFCVLLPLILADDADKQGTAVFKVLNPSDLKAEFDAKKDISVTVGNFGNVPWGRTLIGNVVYPTPYDACTTLDLGSFQGSKIGPPGAINAPIIIADRGGCTFVMKAENAQIAGASMLIVKDNTEENVNFVMPIDDGHGGSINIPTIMINKKTGDKLEGALLDGKTVTVSVSFPMPKTYDRISYEIWLTSSDSTSFDIIKHLSVYQDRLGNNAIMKPHYAVWYCTECEANGYQSFDNTNCFSGGRYCSPDPDGNGPLTGRDTLLEDLRQLCIYQKDPAAWWNYHNYFSKSSLNADDLEKQSYATIRYIGLEEKDIRNCVESSFKTKGDINSINVLLQAEREAFIQRGILTWPSIVINDMTYRGNLEPAELIFKAMCAGFTKKPAACENPVNPYYPPSQGGFPSKATTTKKPNSHMSLIWTIVFIAVAFLAVAFLCYRRQMKREILQEMDYQISSTMHRYMAMKDGDAENEKRRIQIQVTSTLLDRQKVSINDTH